MGQENQKPIRPRRRYSSAFKAQMVGECSVPGASVAATALAHGINANVVRRWRRQEREQSRASAAFIPIAIPPAAQGGMAGCSGEPIEIRLRRGAAQVYVRWPAAGAPALAAWLTELTR